MRRDMSHGRIVAIAPARPLRAGWAPMRAILLCLAAGYADAFGYLRLGGIFTANMTGNSVLLAIAAARRDAGQAAACGLVLAAFLAGALLAALLRRQLVDRRAPALLLAALLLAAAALLPLAGLPAWPGWLLAAGLALAMGLQGASLGRFGGTALQTVVVTGTLLRLAELMAGVRPPAAAPDSRPLALMAGAWLAYAGGALLGAGAADAAVALPARLPETLPLLVPALLQAAVALDLARRGPEGPGAGAR
jgi:uncharacterized membrane protein YoaK (UPF0700 family)